jgi:large subunit ribosomal protein L31
MKQDIHPKYTDLTVTCSCGHSFKTQSTLGKETLMIEVCSECHPFYTGKQKIVDTAGRVERFKNKFGGRSLTGKKES